MTDRWQLEATAEPHFVSFLHMWVSFFCICTMAPLCDRVTCPDKGDLLIDLSGLTIACRCVDSHGTELPIHEYGHAKGDCCPCVDTCLAAIYPDFMVDSLSL